jgi:hypothetical protein
VEHGVDSVVCECDSFLLCLVTKVGEYVFSGDWFNGMRWGRKMAGGGVRIVREEQKEEGDNATVRKWDFLIVMITHFGYFLYFIVKNYLLWNSVEMHGILWFLYYYLETFYCTYLMEVSTSFFTDYE